MTYNIRVAGVTAEDRQLVLETLESFPERQILKFRLQQEPENPYDKNAIAVYSEDLNAKVGYVPKDETHVFNEKLNAGVKFDISGLVVGGSPMYGLNYGLVLKCTTINDNETLNMVEV